MIFLLMFILIRNIAFLTFKVLYFIVYRTLMHIKIAFMAKLFQTSTTLEVLYFIGRR